jgi:hypothetical protein
MAWMKKDDERVKSFEKVREQELKYIVKRQPLATTSCRTRTSLPNA